MTHKSVVKVLSVVWFSFFFLLLLIKQHLIIKFIIIIANFTIILSRNFHYQFNAAVIVLKQLCFSKNIINNNHVSVLITFLLMVQS